MLCDYEQGLREPKFITVVWCLEACGFGLELKKRGDDRETN